MSLPKGAAKRNLTKQEIMNTPFIMFQSHKDDYYNMSQESLRGIQQESVLSKVFFLPKNVDLLQRQLRAEVFRRSGGKYLIPKQNEADLQVVMRSIFLQRARHYPTNITEQVRELNNFVIDDLYPNVMTEIKANIGYQERAFGPMQVLDRPENVSNTGLKRLPSVTRTFGNYHAQ